MEIQENNNGLIVIVDSEIYNIDVLHKCFYWYGGIYDVDINKHENKQLQIRLLPKNKQIFSENSGALIEKIKKDLIDFKLRDIVTKETKTIRELIVAKAFAYYGLGDNPITDVSDPVGFNPEHIKNDRNKQ